MVGQMLHVRSLERRWHGAALRVGGRKPRACRRRTAARGIAKPHSDYTLWLRSHRNPNFEQKRLNESLPLADVP